jgi:hypothetical protein
MNLAIRGIENNLGPENADSFHRDLHKDLKADYILANPPFNDSDWGGERLREDVRWKYGVPPVGNANFAWVQHFIHHLGSTGLAGFVLANGNMSSNHSGEGEIRKASSKRISLIVWSRCRASFSTTLRFLCVSGSLLVTNAIIASAIVAAKRQSNEICTSPRDYKSCDSDADCKPY